MTREQLLDAAERVFREHGVAHSSLAEVAAAAGVTRGAVYWHFRDKADLFSAMCDRATLPLETMLETASAAADGAPLAVLRDLAVAALARLARDPRSRAVFEVMFYKSERSAELAPITERKQRERRHCLEQVEGMLQLAVGKGELPADTDTALAATALHAYVAGIMHQWVLDSDAFDLATAAPALLDALIAGLRAAPPRLAARSKRGAAVEAGPSIPGKA